MKKQLLVLMALMISLTAFSQKVHRIAGWKITRDVPKNEVKLNLGTSIFALFPEVSYERILNTDLSVGASIGFSADTDEIPVNVLFTPYVRWFFGGNSESLSRYAAGFFIEANGGILSRRLGSYEYRGENSTLEEKNVMGGGLGLALGWKYLTARNWVGEIYLGLGRDFVNDEAYPRLGVSIGKRF